MNKKQENLGKIWQIMGFFNLHLNPGRGVYSQKKNMFSEVVIVVLLFTDILSIIKLKKNLKANF